MNQQVKVIVISGNFNASTSSEFHKNIQEVIASDIKTLLIDCHSVTFMDSFGLGTLVVTFKMLEAAGIKMVISSTNEQVKMLFELTGMDNKFTIVPSQKAFEDLLVSAG
ncbi:MAG: STAS domain-containing protein [Dolichospermum sp.]